MKSLERLVGLPTVHGDRSVSMAVHSSVLYNWKSMPGMSAVVQGANHPMFWHNIYSKMFIPGCKNLLIFMRTLVSPNCQNGLKKI